jgi:hypothetical protein
MGHQNQMAGDTVAACASLCALLQWGGGGPGGLGCALVVYATLTITKRVVAAGGGRVLAGTERWRSTPVGNGGRAAACDVSMQPVRGELTIPLKRHAGRVPSDCGGA